MEELLPVHPVFETIHIEIGVPVIEYPIDPVIADYFREKVAYAEKDKLIPGVPLPR
jgi:hypothetical protein